MVVEPVLLSLANRPLAVSREELFFVVVEPLALYGSGVVVLVSVPL